MSAAAAMLNGRSVSQASSTSSRAGLQLVPVAQKAHRRIRGIHVAGTGRTKQVAAAVDEETQQPTGGPFGALVDYFLNRASSSLKRGPATCLTCKGIGSCECPLCKGAGVMDKEQARMNQMRHTAQKLQQMLHVDRSNYNTEWLVTNRCRRCHGYGSVTCPTCGGLGVRSPAVKTPPNQQ